MYTSKYYDLLVLLVLARASPLPVSASRLFHLVDIFFFLYTFSDTFSDIYLLFSCYYGLLTI